MAAWRGEFQRILAAHDWLAMPKLRDLQSAVGMIFAYDLKEYKTQIGVKEISRITFWLLGEVKKHLPHVVAQPAVFQAVESTFIFLRLFFHGVSLADAGIPPLVDELARELKSSIHAIDPDNASRLLSQLETMSDTVLPACAGHKPSYISMREIISQKRVTRQVNQRARLFLDLNLLDADVGKFLSDFRFYFFEQHVEKIKPLLADSEKWPLFYQVLGAAVDKFVALIEQGNPEAVRMLETHIDDLSVYPPVILPAFFGQFWMALLEGIPSRLLGNAMSSEELLVVCEFIKNYFLEDEQLPNIYAAELVFRAANPGLEVVSHVHAYLVTHLLAHRYFPDDAAFADTPRIVEYPAEDEVLIRLQAWYRIPGNKQQAQRDMAFLWDYCLKHHSGKSKPEFRHAFCELFADPHFDFAQIPSE